jgi:hypothetical protein
MDGGTIALAFALTSVPAFLVAQSLARSAQRRDPDRAESGLALTLVRYMRIVGAVMLAGAAAMLWAGYTTGSKPLLARYSPLKLTAASMAFGTIPLVLVSIPAMLQQDWGAPTPGAWVGLLYSAVFAVAIAMLVAVPRRRRG